MLCVFDKGMISSRGTFAATETVERVVFLLRQGRLECLARRAKEKKRKEIRGPFVVTPVSVGTTLHAEEFKQLYYQTKNTSWNQPRLNKEGIYKKLNIN